MAALGLGGFLGGWFFSSSLRSSFGGFGGRLGSFCCGWFGTGVSLGELGQSGFAATDGVSLQEAFFDGFVVFGLSLRKIGRSRISFESLDGSFDALFDFLVVLSALDGLASGFFCGFNNRHENSLLLDNIYI